MYSDESKLDRVLFCFWFGQKMSQNRNDCFSSILQNSGVKVKLITHDNLNEYSIETNPIHQSWQYLSDTHKSDYLRSYIMYHYGGGYSDIKRCDYNWNLYFDILEKSDKEFCGYQEIKSIDIAYTPVKHLYKNLIGNGCYIFKKHTQFAKLWLEETNKKMDEISDELRKYPGNYHPRAINGGIKDGCNFTDSKYPLEWNELLGRIFHRLLSNNLDKYISNMPYINTKNYR